MRTLRHLALLTGLCLLTAVLYAQEDTSIWQQIDDLDQAKDFDGAYALLTPLAVDYGDDVSYLWRMARHHFNVSDNTTDEDVIERELYIGFDFAQKALAADSTSADANGYYGILIGRVGEIEGTRQKIINSYDVAKYTLRAIELDPKNDSWQHVMGRWHYTLAELSWIERQVATLIYGALPEASFDEAEQFFAHAADLAPDDIRHFLWLGKTQLEIDKESAARASLEQAINLVSQSDSDDIMQDEARDLLEDLD